MALETVEGKGPRATAKRRTGTDADLLKSHAARRWRALRFSTCCRCAMRCPQTTAGSRRHGSIVVWLSWRSTDRVATRSARRLANTGSVSSIPIPIPICWRTPPKPIISLPFFGTFTSQVSNGRVRTAGHLLGVKLKAGISCNRPEETPSMPSYASQCRAAPCAGRYRAIGRWPTGGQGDGSAVTVTARETAELPARAECPPAGRRAPRRKTDQRWFRAWQTPWRAPAAV